MTNAEKYLKVNIEDAGDFICGLRDYLDNHKDGYDTSNLIMNYLRKPCKPALLEIEKLILEHIPKKYITIRRMLSGDLQVDLAEHTGFACICAFNCLFKFIEIRTRILNS